MSFRFRVGPFTVGKTGVRLTPWKKAGGFSVPVTKRLDDLVTKEKGERRDAPEGRAVGRIGPARWHLPIGKWWRQMKRGFVEGVEESKREQ